MTLREWWHERHPATRVLAVAIALIVGLNLALAGLEEAIGGSDPGGPGSSSYATGSDGAAAWADLLARRGHTVRRLRTELADAELDPAGTLVIADPTDLTPDEVDALEAFVLAGGRLVSTGRAAVPLLRRLGAGSLDWTSGGTAESRPAAPVPEVAGVSEVRGDRRGAWRSAGAGLPVLTDGRTLVALVGSPGDGRVVAIADPTVVQNEFLDEADNAAFALAVTGDKQATVTFAEAIHGYGESTGLAAIPSQWKWALAIAAAATFLWMWSRARRLGPAEKLARDLAPPRRAYIDAVAASLALTRDPGDAAEPLRRAGRRRLLARAALPPDATDDDVAAAAQKAGLPDDEVDAVLGRRRDEDALVAAATAVAALDDRTPGGS